MPLANLPKSEIGRRWVTGLAGGLLILALLIYAGVAGVFILELVASLGMAYEAAEMLFALPDRVEKRYLLLCLAWFAPFLHLIFGSDELGVLVAYFLGLFVYFLATAKRHDFPGSSDPEDSLLAHLREFMLAIAALLYVVFIPLYLLKMREMPNGRHWVLLFLLIVWGGDTGAYFGGKRWGRRKLYPVISPKKTREGSAAGLATGMVISVVYKWAALPGYTWLGALLLPLVVGASAQVGDLCESFLKRAYAVKDSGSILPGHGGFLDRFDGVVFSLPVMYACIKLIG